MRPEYAGEGGMVPSQTGDDALGTVPVDEYETVFSFPTVGKNSEMCLTRCRGFWLTFYVDAARCDSGQGPRGKKTKYATTSSVCTTTCQLGQVETRRERDGIVA